jgi:hypothetical protein
VILNEYIDYLNNQKYSNYRKISLAMLDVSVGRRKLLKIRAVIVPLCSLLFLTSLKINIFVNTDFVLLTCGIYLFEVLWNRSAREHVTMLRHMPYYNLLI